MDDTLKKYLSEASSFMSDETISEGAKVDKDAAAVVIATEGDEFKGKKGTVKLGTKGLPKKPVIKEEDETEEDSAPIDEEETEEGESCNEDEDDGAEDGEICEGEDDGMGEEEGDEMVDDDQIEEAVGNRTIASMGPGFAKLSHEQKTKFISDRRKMLTKSKHAKAKEALSDLDALEKEVNSKKMDIKESYIAHASRWM